MADLEKSQAEKFYSLCVPRITSQMRDAFFLLKTPTMFEDSWRCSTILKSSSAEII
jgi:hypothetical protein